MIKGAKIVIKYKSSERKVDMYDIGVAIARGELNKQDYVVNW